MPTETTTNITLPFPEVTDRNLRIALGACKLKVSPGAAEPWVVGTYVDHSKALPPLVQQEGGEARIMQNYQAFNPRSLLTGTTAGVTGKGGAGPGGLQSRIFPRESVK